MGTCKRTRTIVKQIGSQQPIGERLGQPWTKETYMSQKPKRLLVLFPCIWWFTLTPGLQFLLNGISVLRLRKDPGYNRVYIYSVCMCICIYINLYLKIYVYVNIHWHTHTYLSLLFYILYKCWPPIYWTMHLCSGHSKSTRRTCWLSTPGCPGTGILREQPQQCMAM